MWQWFRRMDLPERVVFFACVAIVAIGLFLIGMLIVGDMNPGDIPGD